MSSAEIVGAGVIPTTERVAAEAVSIQEAVASPSRPADAELTLRSMEVYIPTEPVNINGQLFNVAVDQEKLIRAINKVAETTVPGTHSLYPRQLVVEASTGQSTVGIGEDLQPKITDTSKDKKTPTLTTFEDSGTSLNITVPSELASTEYSERGLVELVTRQANKDLLIALGQNLQANKKIHLGLRMSSLVLAAGTGEGVGIATSDHWLQMLGRGTLGAVVGAAAGITGVLAADKLRWGKQDNFSPWAIRKSRDYQKIHWQLEKIAKEGSIISLNALQAEQPEVS